MIPESKLEELETACSAAVQCLTRLLAVKTKIESQAEDMVPLLLAEAIKEPAWELLESWRALHVALKPHVHRDFMAVCVEPAQIGEIISVSAHSAAFSVSHLALINLSIVLMPAGYWPSSEDLETDCFLVDFRSETPVAPSENAVRALQTVFDQLSLKELRKCLVLVTRECAAARAQLPAGETVAVDDASRPEDVSLPKAALKAVVHGGLAGVLAAANKVDAATKCSETMMAMLRTDNKYYDWSADDWVSHLQAAKRTILTTDAWDHIKEWRLENKAKRNAK